jgi:hypothetical protein
LHTAITAAFLFLPFSTNRSNIHTPENTHIEFYITAKNSIGYQNIDKKIQELRISGFYEQKDYPNGKFTDKTLNEKQILGLGEKIFEKILLIYGITKPLKKKKLRKIV